MCGRERKRERRQREKRERETWSITCASVGCGRLGNVGREGAGKGKPCPSPHFIAIQADLSLCPFKVKLNGPLPGFPAVFTINSGLKKND